MSGSKSTVCFPATPTSDEPAGRRRSRRRTGSLPTRVNSPSDVALDSRDFASGDLTFATGVLSASFTALKLGAARWNPSPSRRDQWRRRRGHGRGGGVQRDLHHPFLLPADHYFFAPQVQVDSGDFLWLSAPRPIVPPGTPSPPGFIDLQSWTGDGMLDPDWLRVGTDIVGGTPAPTFNAAFSLSAARFPVFELGHDAARLCGFGFAAWRRARQARPVIA